MRLFRCSHQKLLKIDKLIEKKGLANTPRKAVVFVFFWMYFTEILTMFGSSFLSVYGFIMSWWQAKSAPMFVIIWIPLLNWMDCGCAFMWLVGFRGSSIHCCLHYAWNVWHLWICAPICPSRTIIDAFNKYSFPVFLSVCLNVSSVPI